MKMSATYYSKPKISFETLYILLLYFYNSNLKQHSALNFHKTKTISIAVSGAFLGIKMHIVRQGLSLLTDIAQILTVFPSLFQNNLNALCKNFKKQSQNTVIANEKVFGSLD